LTFGVNCAFSNRKARSDDIEAIKAIADAHREELGFVLRPALEDSIQRGEILISENGTGLVGFVEYHHRRDEQTTLYHIVVKTEYRNQGIGRSLILALQKEAEAIGKNVIRLKCPADLPAQDFYDRMGFQIEGEAQGKRRRLVLWAFPIENKDM
jgi:ribosomal protein S18 acetylase RimI-like enzyme